MNEDTLNEETQKNTASLDLKHLNWPTVILILVTGGGNWFAQDKIIGKNCS